MVMWKGLLRVSKCAILLVTKVITIFLQLQVKNNVHNPLIVYKKTFYYGKTSAYIIELYIPVYAKFKKWHS